MPDIWASKYPKTCPHAPGPLADAGQLVAKVNIEVVLHYVIDFAHHNLPHRVAHLQTGFSSDIYLDQKYGPGALDL